MEDNLSLEEYEKLTREYKNRARKFWGKKCKKKEPVDRCSRGCPLWNQKRPKKDEMFYCILGVGNAI